MSYSDFEAVLLGWGMKRKAEYKGEASVCCFPLLSSPFRKGLHLINIVKILGKISFEQRIRKRIRRRKSLKTTKDQNTTVLTLFQLNNLKPIWLYN